MRTLSPIWYAIDSSQLFFTETVRVPVCFVVTLSTPVSFSTTESAPICVGIEPTLTVSGGVELASAATSEAPPASN